MCIFASYRSEQTIYRPFPEEAARKLFSMSFIMFETFLGFGAGSAAADLSGVFAVEIGAPGTGLSKRKYSCFQNVVHDEFSFR